MTQWVQHISRQGKKWQVSLELSEQWRCEPYTTQDQYYYLPKSEYTPCDPPEVWRDVTEDCRMIQSAPGIPSQFVGGIDSHDAKVLFEPTHWAKGYRLRKVQSFALGSCEWYFKVEKLAP